LTLVTWAYNTAYCATVHTRDSKWPHENANAGVCSICAFSLYTKPLLCLRHLTLSAKPLCFRAVHLPRSSFCSLVQTVQF